MIIDYDLKYNDDVKKLFLELQRYIVDIDKEGYNIIKSGFEKQFVLDTMKEIKEYNGKIMLLKEHDEIAGLVVGHIINEEIDTYDFKAPKRGRITELIVSKKYRSKGYGKILLNAMEDYLKNKGCKAILIEVFGYNDLALNFYEKNNYHTRMIEVIKTI